MNTIYSRTVLPNGIRVVTEYMPHVRSVSFGAWFQFGSRDETPEINGLGHFLEHMVFKGTKKRNTAQIAEVLESVGGNLNAFTSKEFTCYYAYILDEHIELAVDVISDLIINASLSEDEVVKEKRVVSEEISSLEDTPDEMIHEYFHQNIFSEHPLSQSILGTRENLGGFDRDILRKYWAARYVGSNLIISAAGNVDHESLTKLVEKNFDIPSGVPAVRENGRYAQKPRENVHEHNIGQAHICVGNRGVQYSDVNKYALLILHSILGGGMSSRLFQNIREKHGVAYAIFSFTDFYMDTGLFGVYIGVDKANIRRAIELIRKEFDSLIGLGVQKEELERFKSQLKGNLVLGLENTYSRMNRLAKMEMYLHSYFTLDKVLKNITNVTAAQVKELAGEILSGDMYTSIISPR